jgi:ATP-dependent Clp protease protease subunit
MTTTPAADELQRRLLKERIVFLGSEIDDAVANLVCSQLLLLEADDPPRHTGRADQRDIKLYINSPGGSVDSGFAIYDTMQFLSCDVVTVCVGLAASMGQFLLCAGAAGKRYALPHARILMHQPHGQMQGTAADIQINAEQFQLLRRLMAERTAHHTGQSVARIIEDSDRDRWFTAEQALAYGMVDQVLNRESRVAASAVVGAG